MKLKETFIFGLLVNYAYDVPAGTDLAAFCRAYKADYRRMERFTASLQADGSVVEEPPGSDVFRLTRAGYDKYSFRVATHKQMAERWERGLIRRRTGSRLANPSPSRLSRGPNDTTT